jgi:hypothetical protein
MGESGAAVFQILSGKVSLDSKLRRACEAQPEAWTWTSEKWSTLTGNVASIRSLVAATVSLTN